MSTTPTATTPASSTVPKVGYYRWVICVLLLFAATINYIDRQVIGILKPTLTEAFHWNDERIYSSIIFAFSLAYALGFIFAGRVIDKLGTRRGFALAVVLWSIAAVAHGAAGWFPGLHIPMLNLDAVLTAVRRMADNQLGGLGWRQITVSTVGIVPGIEALMATGLNVQLADSLHAPDDATRAKLLPMGRRFPIADILAAADGFQARRGRPVTRPPTHWTRPRSPPGSSCTPTGRSSPAPARPRRARRPPPSTRRSSPRNSTWTRRRSR